MNSNIDNCIDIYINADPREVYEKYGNTGCYTVETNFFKFAQKPTKLWMFNDTRVPMHDTRVVGSKSIPGYQVPGYG